MLKKIIISFGIALVIGVIAGFVFSEEKYFYLDPSTPKREITKENFKSFGSSPRVRKEQVYNSSKSAIIGIGSFGGLLVILMLVKTKKYN